HGRPRARARGDDRGVSARPAARRRRRRGRRLGRGEGVTARGVPDGYPTLSPYLLVEDAEGLLSFVSVVFATEVRSRMTGEAGGLHAEVELGDSLLMVGEGVGST